MKFKTAHDVRQMRVCRHCRQPGDKRRMLVVNGGPWHDDCVVKTMTVTQILQLPAAERAKISILAAGPDLMRKLLAASHLDLVLD